MKQTKQAREQEAQRIAVENKLRDDAIKITLDRYRKKRLVFNAEFIREMYAVAIENYGISAQVYSHVKLNPFEIARATDVIEYICEFHLLNINGAPPAQVMAMESSDEYRNALGRDVGKALFFVEHIISSDFRGIDKRNPLIVFPSVLFNYLLTVMENLDSRNVFLGNRRSTLCSLYQYMILQMQSILSLLSINIKDAVCLWRNLHETECIATILYKNREEVTDEFIYFQKFAFIDEYESDKPDVREISDLYTSFKKDHREMKATRDEFREKGWLRLADGFSAENGFNVKRGLQPMAGLSDRYQAYRDASRIVHPSGITYSMNIRSSLVFVYDQILLTTTNLLSQIRGLAYEDRPDSFDRETTTLLQIITAYFNLFKKGEGTSPSDLG